MNNLEFIKEPFEHLYSVDRSTRLTAINRYKNLNITKIAYLTDKLFCINDIYDSSLINILASFGEAGINMLYSCFLLKFQKGFEIEIESEYGTHIVNSLLKYVYNDTNVDVILNNTFDINIKNKVFKSFFYKLLEISITPSKNKFNFKNTLKIQRELENNNFVFTRIDCITEQQKNDFFDALHNLVKLKNENKNFDKVSKIFSKLCLKSYIICPQIGKMFINYINADINKEVRNYVFEEYKNIVKLYYNENYEWAQKTIGLIIYVEIFLNIPTKEIYLSKIHSFNKQYCCFVDYALIRNYVKINIFADTTNYVLTNSKLCLDGHIWSIRSYEGLLLLLDEHDIEAISILKNLLKYISDNKFFVNDIFVNNIVLGIKSFFNLSYATYTDYMIFSQERYRIGKEWEHICLEYLKTKYKNIKYQYRLSNNNIIDIGINFSNETNLFEFIVECKKSLYFMKEQQSWTNTSIKDNSTVKKYISFCNSLIFFVLDDPSENIGKIESVENIKIIFAKELLESYNISQEVALKIRNLSEKSKELNKKFKEEMAYLLENPIETFLHYNISNTLQSDIHDIIKIFDNIKIK